MGWRWRAGFVHPIVSPSFIASQKIKAPTAPTRLVGERRGCFVFPGILKLKAESCKLTAVTMLYTGRGDDGTTQLFACDGRVEKSGVVAEALGAVDELNSLLGWLKLAAGDEKFQQTLTAIQQNLFIIQATLGGAAKSLPQAATADLEKRIKEIERQLPPLRHFTVAGGTTLAAMLDYARAVARRAERRVVGARAAGEVKIEAAALAYLNRLSSFLFAEARLANHAAGVKEEVPKY